MLVKIAVSGAHGTGKTTLCDHLNNKFTLKPGFAICREVPRIIIDTVQDNGFFHRDNNTITRQMLIFMYQLNEEQKCGLNQKIILCDRTPVDHLAYTLLNHPNFESSQEFLALEYLIRDWLSTFDTIFKIPIEFPPKDDGVREGAKDFQIEVDRSIDRLYELFGVSCPDLTGSVTDRAKPLEKIISELLGA